jgi:hypothetical protein
LGRVASRATFCRDAERHFYDIDGFVEASDRDYEPVRDALQLMNLGRPK